MGEGAGARGEVDGGSRALYPKLKPGPGMSAEQVAANQRLRIQGAMIELVARQGYTETTVRDIVQAAGVSKRAFYDRYPGGEGCGGKEECLLDTYDLLVRRLAQQVQAARRAGRDCREQLRCGYGAFLTKLAEARKAAMFALVEVLAAGPAARRRAAQTTVLLEAMVRDSFACSPDAVSLPPQLAKGIVAGAARVSRARLLAGREAELPILADELTEWSLSFRDEVAERLRALPPIDSARPPRRGGRPLDAAAGDERSLILAATARLAAADGYRALTVPRIRSLAGVSRKRFDANFDGVEKCFLAALDREVGASLEEAARTIRLAPTWSEGVCRAVLGICDRVAEDAELARLAFFEVLELGRPGVRWRAALIGELARGFRAGSSGEERPTELASEASLGAVWSLMHYMVNTGRRRELPHLADSFAFLLLAPPLGAPAAVEVIEAARKEAPEAVLM